MVPNAYYRARTIEKTNWKELSMRMGPVRLTTNKPTHKIISNKG
jgi:hypothetical protein